MTRRVTAGVTGGAGVSGLQAVTTTITSANNLDIVVNPSGTGKFLVDGDAQLQAQGDLRFADADNSNWVAFQAPATIASDVTWTLPAADGSTRQTLTTAGNGTLSWQTPTVAIQNNTTDSSTHYVTLTTATSDTAVDTLRRSSSGITFQPSTGTLTVTNFVESSSITLKENINPIENALDSITRLSGVTYDRTDSKTHEAGLIAEWVDTVLPELVTRDEQGNALGIKYTKLTAYLIEAVKSLKQEIDLLKRSK